MFPASPVLYSTTSPSGLIQPPTPLPISNMPVHNRMWPSEYLHYHCPLCFGGCHKTDVDQEISSEFDIIVCIDTCFTQKCHNDPVNPTSSIFLKQQDVDAMEHEVEELRRSQPLRNRAARGIVETEDLCEHGMRVPTSVLDGCDESFTAADEKCQKVCKHSFFSDTGIMALLCHHDHVIHLVNMTYTNITISLVTVYTGNR
ncbi:hypothetical protein SCLCIDRAFT_1146700 [Scleroderma citrinum Foug A]|uniref:Uncharacterized protein n=1 Tax=Scleroderma citrinum Foug A TaxID=1036808 RepID=A0A0C2Z3F5_9AGAM|nr:hypothetical protein SCLCIDRAFT_1146700 [Scleroderma citrinum Foug A]